MDSGELDFYQHDKVCSNTCRSTKIDLSGARVSLSSPTSAEYLPLTPATADGMCDACLVSPVPLLLAMELMGKSAPQLGQLGPSDLWSVAIPPSLQKSELIFHRQGRFEHFFFLSHFCYKTEIPT